MKITNKMIDRYDELLDRAIGRYLDKTDFNAYVWLYGEEAKEFKKLSKNLGYE